MLPTLGFPRRQFCTIRQVVVFVSLGFVVVFNLHHLRFLNRGFRAPAKSSKSHVDLHAGGESRFTPPSATWQRSIESKNQCERSTFVAGAVPKVPPKRVSRKSRDEDGFLLEEDDSSSIWSDNEGGDMIGDGTGDGGGGLSAMAAIGASSGVAIQLSAINTDASILSGLTEGA